MSRTANGWIPSRQGCDTAVDGEDDEAWGDVSITQQAASPTQEVVGTARSPIGTQREVDEQRLAWGLQWDTGQPRKEPDWPAVVLNQIPEMTVGMLTAACMSFPCGTGLGWDMMYPRALTRLPRSLLLQVVLCLMAAEVTGEWPQLVGWVANRAPPVLAKNLVADQAEHRSRMGESKRPRVLVRRHGERVGSGRMAASRQSGASGIGRQILCTRTVRLSRSLRADPTLGLAS